LKNESLYVGRPAALRRGQLPIGKAPEAEPGRAVTDLANASGEVDTEPRRQARARCRTRIRDQR
jgi:hypothetical protein